MFWNPCRWKLSDKVITGESYHRGFVQASETSSQEDQDEGVCRTWIRISAVEADFYIKWRTPATKLVLSTQCIVHISFWNMFQSYSAMWMHYLFPNEFYVQGFLLAYDLWMTETIMTNRWSLVLHNSIKLNDKVKITFFLTLKSVHSPFYLRLSEIPQGVWVSICRAFKIFSMSQKALKCYNH